MSEEQKQKLNDLFQEFMATPEIMYPWNIYNKWKEIRENASTYDNEKWTELIYENSICSSRGDGANKNDVSNDLKEKLSNFVNEKDSTKISTELNTLFNTSQKANSKQRNFETRINRLVSIFDDKSSFIPSPNKFKECLKYLEKKCGIKVESKVWKEQNQELNQKLYDMLKEQLEGSLQKDKEKDKEIFILKAFPTWIQFSKDHLFPTEKIQM